MAAGYFTVIAVSFSLMVSGTEAQDVLSARSIELDLPAGFSVDPGDGEDFQFGMDVKIHRPTSDKKISGSNLWQVSAWFGASADGSGPRVGFVGQTLDGIQAATTFVKKTGRFTITGIQYSLAPTRQPCQDVSYFCVLFDETPEASVDTDVRGYPDESSLTKCERVQCEESPTNCIDDGTTYEIGAKWTPDVCTACSCLETGEVYCAEEFCDPPVCRGGLEPIVRPGDCCAVCPQDCLSDSQVYFHQEEWRVSDCRTCACFDGTADCETEICPFLNCDAAEQVRGEGQCCAECAEECFFSADGNTYVHGETWEPDVCTDCQCDNGSNICDREVCDPPGCAARFVVNRPDECCPDCGRDCAYQGRTYRHLGQWLPDPCTECRCYDGESNCVETTCPRMNCGSDRRVIHPEGQCCPSCSEGDPLRLRSLIVKIKFSGYARLRIKNGSALVRLTPIIRFLDEGKAVEGTNLWQVSAWLKDDRDRVISPVDQILSVRQSSQSLIPYRRFNLGETKIIFKVDDAGCDDLPSVCIRFDLTDNPLAYNASLFLEESSTKETCALLPKCRVKL